MIFHVREEEVAFAVEADLVGFIEIGSGGGPALAGVALLARAGDDASLAGFQVHAPHDMGIDVTPVERAVGADDEAIGVVDLAVV